MRNRRWFNIAAAISLLILVATLLAMDRSYEGGGVISDPFPFNNQQFAQQFVDGQIVLTNSPQIETESDEFVASLRRETEEYQSRRAAVYRAQPKYPANSKTNRDKWAALDRLEAGYKALRLRVRPTGLTRPVTHAMSIMYIAIPASIVPTIWITSWIRRRPRVRRELRYPRSLAAIALLLLTVSIVFAIIRSYWFGVTWEMALQQGPPVTNAVATIKNDSWYFCRAIVFSSGRIELVSFQYWAKTGKYHEPDGLVRGGWIDGTEPPMCTKTVFPVPPPAYWWAYGFGRISRQHGVESHGYPINGRNGYIISAWYPCGICFLFPVVWIRRRWPALRRESRRMLNQCIPCGYDLTGNTSGVCPECGRATAVTR